MELEQYFCYINRKLGTWNYIIIDHGKKELSESIYPQRVFLTSSASTIRISKKQYEFMKRRLCNIGGYKNYIWEYSSEDAEKIIATF